MIVGLVGFIGSGKGTAGDILAARGFLRDSFAAPVKDAVSVIFGWPRFLLEGDTNQSRAFREMPDDFWSEVMGRPFTPREALQQMGTEAGRNVYHPDIWTRALERRITSSNDKSDFVITDVRFNNEAKLIRQLGGRVIEVTRGRLPEWYEYAIQLNEDNNWDGNVQKMDEFPHVHYSEWAWIGSPEITDVVSNDGTVADLESSLLAILKN
jgi:hypothetical protein